MPSRVRSVLIGIGLLVVAGAVVAMRGCVSSRKVEAALGEAAVHHEGAVAHAAAAAVRDGQADELAAKVLASGREIARLRAELKRQQDAAAPSEPAPVPVEPPVVDPIDATKDELIQAYERRDQDQEAEILALTQARDEWRSAAKASQAEVIQVRAALAAQQGLASSEKWQARFDGLKVGIPAGIALDLLVRRLR
ncbi:MAG TPA: hypothetical protein PKL14_07045 [Holophaga sp.]|nr:hypothetical protein [Holophaga sp.]